MSASTATPRVSAHEGSFVEMSDGTQVYFKDWGSGQLGGRPKEATTERTT